MSDAESSRQMDAAEDTAESDQMPRSRNNVAPVWVDICPPGQKCNPSSSKYSNVMYKCERWTAAPQPNGPYRSSTGGLPVREH